MARRACWAALRNARKVHHAAGFWLVGEVYGDPQHRFANGDVVQTSLVVGERPEPEGMVYETESGSLYCVTSWRE
jgi:hypothetical protein